MLNDAHLNVRDTIQQLQRGVLMTNIADSVSSISRFLLNNKKLPRKFQTFLPNMQNYEIQVSRKYYFILLEN